MHNHSSVAFCVLRSSLRQTPINRSILYELREFLGLQNGPDLSKLSQTMKSEFLGWLSPAIPEKRGVNAAADSVGRPLSFTQHGTATRVPVLLPTPYKHSVR